MSDKKIDRALKFDALAEAEKITGKSYKNDELTESLGFLMHIEAGAAKKKLLQEAGDTHFRMTPQEFIDVIVGYGFEVGYMEQFVDDHYDEPSNSTLYIFFHREKGLILKFDTYFNGTSVNSAKVYYNFQVDEKGCLGEVEGYEGPHLWHYTSSGHYEEVDGDPIWIGDHDARERLLHNMRKIEEIGHFLPVWRKAPFARFLHYTEYNRGPYKSSDQDVYDAINKKRIDSFCPQLKEIMAVMYEEREDA